MNRTELEDLFPLEQRPLPLLSRSQDAVLEHVYQPLEHARVDTQQRVRNARMYAAGSAVEALVGCLLPVLDTLEAILSQTQEFPAEEQAYFQNWLRSLSACQKRLLRVLEREGLAPIEAVGRPVDLSVHDVIKVHPRPHVEEPRVVEELEKGYRFRDRVLRDAKVIAEVPLEQTQNSVAGETRDMST